MRLRLSALACSVALMAAIAIAPLTAAAATLAAGPLSGIAVHGTETTIVRVDLPATSVYGAGSYILITTVAHFAFASHGPVTTFTNTTNDYGDVIYNAAGEAIGSATFHLVEHFTLFDLGAPGPSPEDKVVVNFERWRVTCP